MTNKNIFTYLLFFFLFFLSSIYSYFTYITFSSFEIFKVSIAFFLLIIFLLGFSNQLFKINRFPNLKEIIFSFLFSIYFSILIHQLELRWIISYFQTFPLFESSNSPDSSFHLAQIRSIMLTGYPSTGQHDLPFHIYHSLSHYIDAIILKVTSVDPFLSYGLMFFYKQIIFLTSIIFLINKFSKKLKTNFFFFILFFFPLLFISSWHFVASHGLWFVSILLIVLFPAIYETIIKKNNIKDYIFILFIIIFLSLGKVTLGATVGLLVGICIYIKNYKNLGIYIVAIFIFSFFLLFLNLIGRNLLDQFNFNIFEILNFALKQKELISILLVLVLFCVVFKDKNFTIIAISSIISFFIVLSVASNQEWKSDASYLIFGLRFIYILLALKLTIETLESDKVILKRINFVNLKYLVIFLLIIFCIINPIKILQYENVFLLRKNFYFKKESINLNNSLVAILNKSKIFFTRDIRYIAHRKTSLFSFKKRLNTFMQKNNLTSKNSLLFIPKEVFENNIKNSLGKQKNYQGLHIYASTGVPLINSVNNAQLTYGFARYSRSSFRMSLDSFVKTDYCNFNKNIIVTLNYRKNKFKLIKCK